MKAASKPAPKNVDAYIAAAPPAVQPMLHQLRKVIRSAAPAAVEKIGYGMPFYSYHGRLVYFALHSKHIGLYPVGPARDRYGDELKPYLAEKSTLRFPIDQALPIPLIRKVMRALVEQNEARG